MAEAQPHRRLEIAHVLLMHIVGFSKSLINEQSEMLRQLNQVVRDTDQVKAAEAAGRLVRIPTGDGMALGFFTTPDAPLRSAIEISQALKSLPNIPVRMGINSGPVDEIVDVNERSNIAGTGITLAQRVMDCGDAGHILLSNRLADDLAQYASWRPHLHDLGRCEVKHGTKIEVINFYTDEIGNRAIPEKFKKENRIIAAKSSKYLRDAALIATTLLLAFGVWFFAHRAREASRSAHVDGIAARSAK